LSRPGKEPCYQQAEDEPADVAKTAAPPPFAEAPNSPRLASMSWYKNHSPRKIPTRKAGKMYVRIREPG